MKLEVISGLLCLVCGLLVSHSDGKPLDADSIKENIQMAALNAAGMAMEMADNIKPSGMLKGEFAFGGRGSDSSEEDRKRRRRSVDDIDLAEFQIRQKRSPCGHRRRMQATQAPATTTAAPDTEDIPRRRRRSADENDIDENDNIIPGAAKRIHESAHELSEKIRQALKTALENMNSMLDAIGQSIRRAFDKEAQDSEAV